MTLSIFDQTYSSKATAVRGAKRANLEVGTFTIEMKDDRFMIAPVAIEPVIVEVVAEPVVEAQPQVVNVTLKSIVTNNPSTIVKPVDFVHAFLDAAPDLGRKQAIIALVEAGINYATARTQYQRWFTKRKTA